MSVLSKLKVLVILSGLFLISNAQAAVVAQQDCDQLGASQISEDRTMILSCLLKEPSTTATCSDSPGCKWKPMQTYGAWIASPPSQILHGTDPQQIFAEMGATNNYSPTEWCQRNGYSYASGPCKGPIPAIWPTSNAMMEGSLMTNSTGASGANVGRWSWACWYGAIDYYFAPTTMILCQ